MVDVAQQAFVTKNFHLAAEVYERSIKENGPSASLFLALGDSYARCSEFRKALDAYTKAFRLGKHSITPSNLKHLVEGLVEYMSEKGEELNIVPPQEELDVFSCGLCRGLLTEPLTIPCGHTYCRKCYVKDGTKSCKKCGVIHHFLDLKTVKNNVVIAGILEKLFPTETSAVDLKSKGNRLFMNGNYTGAIDIYTKALDFAPNDHLIISNRSHAYAALDKYQESLDDAELTVLTKPDWAKGYYRKGVALSGLGKAEQAAHAYLQCLAIDPNVTAARDALARELYSLLNPIEPVDVKHYELQQSLNPGPLNCLMSSADTLDNLTSAENVSRIKTALKERLRENGYLPDDKDSKSDEASLNFGQNSKSEGLSSSGSTDSLNRKRASVDLGASCDAPPVKDESGSPKSKKFKRSFDESLLNKDDYECSLCFRLYFEPVATPCGHCFCRACLERSLDHNVACPLCKSCLAEYLAERRQATVEVIDEIITTFFEDDYIERKKTHEEEMTSIIHDQEDGLIEIPIFVCTTAYPSVACPLHIFEPRYRLMLRQCMESGSRQFGMCISVGEDENEFTEFGTILEIRDVQFFPDGRSVVDTIGSRRFKVVSRGTRDGYHTAKIQYLNDNDIPNSEINEVRALADEVYSGCRDWLQTLGTAKGRIFKHFGEFPEMTEVQIECPNGPAWAWWILAVLPLDPRAQVSLLGMTSLKDRLTAMKNVLAFLKRKSK